jgi:Xaa-Pro aminopeptidase
MRAEAPVDVRTRADGQSYEAQVKSVLAELKAEARNVGVGGNLPASSFIALASAASGAQFVDASHWLDRTRMIKDPEEIVRISNVARLTDHVMDTVVSRISAGLSQNELMLQIEMEARRQGASNVSFTPFAGYMKSGAGATEGITNVPPDEGLEADTAICFDIGFVLDGYASDWGRSVFWGNPPADTAAAYKALSEAVVEVVGTMSDGAMRACDVYPAIEKALDARGYGDAMRRRLAEHKVMGHSIGIEVHEHPWLGPRCDEVLRENMVLAVEPKLWHPGEYYLRLEELVLVTKSGGEFLTNFDRNLFVL